MHPFGSVKIMLNGKFQGEMSLINLTILYSFNVESTLFFGKKKLIASYENFISPSLKYFMNKPEIFSAIEAIESSFQYLKPIHFSNNAFHFMKTRYFI